MNQFIKVSAYDTMEIHEKKVVDSCIYMTNIGVKLIGSAQERNTVWEKFIADHNEKFSQQPL